MRMNGAKRMDPEGVAEHRNMLYIGEFNWE